MTAHAAALIRGVSALYVDPRGPYPGLVEDWWDESRDARTYAGPWPVVTHPPCGRWCALAPLNAVRYGYKIGDDGGCFSSALACVRRWGGVLEHPAESLAWRTFGLLEPLRGAWRSTLARDGWSTELSQSAFGHRARKRTWLYAVGVDIHALDWSDPPVTARIVFAPGSTPATRVRGREASRTPPAFAAWLVSLALTARRP